MIRTSNIGVEIKGDVGTIISEFAFIIYGVRQTLIDAYNEEVADKMIADIGRIAVKVGESDDTGDELEELCSQLAEETAELAAKGDE